jgi:hypothetical protein
MEDDRRDHLRRGVKAARGSGVLPSAPEGSLGRSSSSFLVSPERAFMKETTGILSFLLGE